MKNRKAIHEVGLSAASILMLTKQSVPAPIKGLLEILNVPGKPSDKIGPICELFGMLHRKPGEGGFERGYEERWLGADCLFVMTHEVMMYMAKHELVAVFLRNLASYGYELGNGYRKDHIWAMEFIVSLGALKSLAIIAGTDHVYANDVLANGWMRLVNDYEQVYLMSLGGYLQMSSVLEDYGDSSEDRKQRNAQAEEKVASKWLSRYAQIDWRSAEGAMIVAGIGMLNTAGYFQASNRASALTEFLNQCAHKHVNALDCSQTASAMVMFQEWISRPDPDVSQEV